MNTKEYLKQYKKLCGKTRRYKERIEQIEASLNKSLEIDGLPKGTKPGNPTQDTAIRLAEIRTKLKEALVEAEYARQRIAEEIEQMDTPTYKELLYSRYILLLTWEEVTDRVSEGRKERYDTKHIMSYMHSQALKEFGRIRCMFTDPLKEKALEVIERALKGSNVDKVFASYYGGTGTESFAAAFLVVAYGKDTREIVMSQDKILKMMTTYKLDMSLDPETQDWIFRINIQGDDKQ